MIVDPIGNLPDEILVHRVRVGYEKYMKLYNEHCTHDCKENQCDKRDTDHIQNVCWILDEILGVYK